LQEAHRTPGPPDRATSPTSLSVREVLQCRAGSGAWLRPFFQRCPGPLASHPEATQYRARRAWGNPTASRTSRAGIHVGTVLAESADEAARLEEQVAWQALNTAATGRRDTWRAMTDSKRARARANMSNHTLTRFHTRITRAHAPSHTRTHKPARTHRDSARRDALRPRSAVQHETLEPSGSRCNAFRCSGSCCNTTRCNRAGPVATRSVAGRALARSVITAVPRRC
jgi:hypothetical protein